MAKRMTATARFCAAIVAMTALAGIAVQFTATYSANHDVWATFWILLRFFTILANLLIIATFTRIARARLMQGPRWLPGGAVLAILLVGIVYGLLLRGLLDLSGGAKLADTLLHKVTPVLAPLWWLAFAPKRTLRWRDPLIWAIFPAAYLPYALARGLTDGVYAYPFINLASLGWGQVLVNSAAIATAFLAAGFAFVWIDRRLGKGGF